MSLEPQPHTASLPGISVIIPTWRRVDLLETTLARLAACAPGPDEILVHVDHGDHETAAHLAAAHPAVKVLASSTQVGPGGGRNKLVRAAQRAILVSLDDDSFPIDPDFFHRTAKIMEAYPEASVVACNIFHRDEKEPEDRPEACWSSSFVGCGCIYRRDDILPLEGYLDLPLAYGAEEVDLALQLFGAGRKILFTRWLRVFHNTSMAHHESAAINAAKIANLALLAYVRYPAPLMTRGVLQVLNRVVYAVTARRYHGIAEGIGSIPRHLWRHRGLRSPVPLAAARRYLDMRNNTEPTVWRLEPSAAPVAGAPERGL